MKKKLVSLVLVLTILLGTATPFSYADNDISNLLLVDVPTNQYSISSDEALETLKEYGFTDDEIIYLYQTEADKLNYPIELPNELQSTYGDAVYPISFAKGSSLPSNPPVGSYHPIDFDINFGTLATALGASGLLGDKAIEYILKHSKNQIAKEIIKECGLAQLFVGMEIAGALIALGSILFGYNGIRGEQEWYYGEDNHMNIGWTPGYMDYRFY